LSPIRWMPGAIFMMRASTRQDNRQPRVAQLPPGRTHSAIRAKSANTG